MQCLLPALTTLLLIPMQDKWVGEIQKSRTLQFILHVVRTHPRAVGTRNRGELGSHRPSPHPSVFGISINPILTGGQIMPTTLLLAPTDSPPFLRPCNQCNWHTDIQPVLSYKKTDKTMHNQSIAKKA